MPSSSQRQPRVTPAAGRGTERKQTVDGQDRERESASGESVDKVARGRVKADGRAIEVTILDRKLRIACKDEEKDDLLKAVQYLDAKMREIRDGGKVVGGERIAILAALNIAHELLSMRVGDGFDIGEFKGRMQSMAAAIDEAMAAQEDLF